MNKFWNDVAAACPAPVVDMGLEPPADNVPALIEPQGAQPVDNGTSEALAAALERIAALEEKLKGVTEEV